MTTTRNGSKVEQVRIWILRQITLGNFPRGAMLPPERELAATLGVSYMTLRRAIGLLVEEHYLERVPSIGTFVRTCISTAKVQKLLGVIIPAWSVPENSDFVIHITELAERENYMVKLVFARSWDDRAVLDAWANCEALLCQPPAPLSELPESLRKKFTSGEKPVIFIGVPGHHLGFDTVMGSPELESNLITERLIQAGHTRIAFTDQYSCQDGVLSRQSPVLYTTWHHKVKPLVNANLLKLLDLTCETPRYQMPHQAIYEKIVSFGKNPPFTALICPMAFILSAMAAFEDLKLNIPDQVSLTAIGDRQEARFLRPRLSYLQVSLREHAIRALEAIRNREADPGLPVQYLMIPPVFIEGESIAAPRPVPQQKAQ